MKVWPWYFLLPLFLGLAPLKRDRFFGITLQNIAHLSSIVESIKNLHRPVVTRIVLNSDLSPSYYADAIEQLSAISKLQIRLMDSYSLRNYSAKEYVAYIQSYLNAFGNKVAIWEIGNDVNTERMLSSYSQKETDELAQKLIKAYRLIKFRGYKVALTLRYNGVDRRGGITSSENCWVYPQEAMLAWAKRNLPEEMREGLDYVWVSYYEDECGGYKPLWENVFQKLGEVFPYSMMGIGECGSKDAHDLATGKEAAFLTRYYQEIDQEVAHPRYVGGDFWWFYVRDMVPLNRPLWKNFDQLMRRSPGLIEGQEIFLSVDNISMNLGSRSLDPGLSALNTLDQIDHQDNDASYIKFFESGKNGLQATLTVPFAKDLSSDDVTSMSLIANVMMPQMKSQLWQFQIKNFKTNHWEKLGDNTEVFDWKWTTLTFPISGVAPYLDPMSNKIYLRLSTPATKSPEGAQLDYLQIKLTVGRNKK